MKFFLLFVLLVTGVGAFAQTPLLLQNGITDNTTYLSVANATTTYAPITVSQIYTSGSTVTANNATTWLIINPSSTVAALAITMPATPYDNQYVDISVGGTITSGTVITLISVLANSGQAIIQPFALDIIAAGETLSYRYNLSQKIWYRL